MSIIDKVTGELKKKHLRITQISIAVIIILFLIVLLAKHCTNVKQREYEGIRDKYRDSIIYYKDKAGDQVAKIYERVVTESSPEDRRKIDSLAKQLSIKNKAISQYVEIISKSDFSKSTGTRDSIIYRDSLPVYYYSYNSKYLSYRAIASDSLRFSYFQVRDSLYGIFSTKKIGRKEYRELNIKNNNPNTTIVGLRSISIPVQKEYSRISFGVSVGMNPFNQQPALIIGVNYSLLRFKKKI